MALPSAADVLKTQLRHAWLDSRRVLHDVTEDEYRWEPSSPCWSVRRRDPSVRGWGAGEFVCEDAWPPPDPLPMTTIAWRVVHLAAWTDIYRKYAFGDARPNLDEADVPGDMNAALAWLYRAQDDFIDAVAGLSDDAAFEPRPAHWGQSVPVVRLVTTMLTSMSITSPRSACCAIFGEDTHAPSRHRHPSRIPRGGRARRRQAPELPLGVRQRRKCQSSIAATFGARAGVSGPGAGSSPGIG